MAAVPLVLGAEAQQDVLVLVHDAEREEGRLLEPLHVHHALGHRVGAPRVVRRVPLRLPVGKGRPMQAAPEHKMSNEFACVKSFATREGILPM